MRRHNVIILLCIGVFGFSLHNIYQSSTVTDLSWPRAAPVAHHVAPHIGQNKMVIQVISGGLGQNLSELIHSDGNHLRDKFHGEFQRLPDKNMPHLLESIPGRRKRIARENDMSPVYTNHQGELDDDVMLEMAKNQCDIQGRDVIYKDINGSKVKVPLWQQKLEHCGALGQSVNGSWKYILAELLQVRIYSVDPAKWTIRELKQWMHFLFLAGVEHIFICDHYKNQSERLDVPLKRYIARRLVTYLPWSSIRNPIQAQLKCYQYIIDNYKQYTRWQIAVDIDEYPFSTLDRQEGFLIRYLHNVTLQYGTRVSEISMNNFLMLGQGDRTRNLVIDRINRMTPKPANQLTKPIYRPERVRANLHHNRLLFGSHMTANDNQLKMLHYWGARLQDWGPDTNRTLAITRIMNGMCNAWAPRVRESLLAFGEYDAFSSETGP